VFSLLKNHIEIMLLMLDTCRKFHISLNLRKCIVHAPFSILLGHVVCKQGLLINHAKIIVIIDMPPRTSVRQMRAILGHTGYYKIFIRGYMQITTLLENLLKKEVKYQWNAKCQQSLHTLKKKLVTVPILVFPDWKKEFHVHVDPSFIALGTFLDQLGEGGFDHPIEFSSRNLSTTETKLYYYKA
jgi:hypothetical protein